MIIRALCMHDIKPALSNCCLLSPFSFAMCTRSTLLPTVPTNLLTPPLSPFIFLAGGQRSHAAGPPRRIVAFGGEDRGGGELVGRRASCASGEPCAHIQRTEGPLHRPVPSTRTHIYTHTNTHLLTPLCPLSCLLQGASEATRQARLDELSRLEAKIAGEESLLAAAQVVLRESRARIHSEKRVLSTALSPPVSTEDLNAPPPTKPERKTVQSVQQHALAPASAATVRPAYANLNTSNPAPPVSLPPARTQAKTGAGISGGAVNSLGTKVFYSYPCLCVVFLSVLSRLILACLGAFRAAMHSLGAQ